MKKHHTTMKSQDLLVCSECGNTERFAEVMAVEIHLVNGRKDYIRLLEGIADHYRCWNCGAAIREATTEKA